jgi:transcriptional regulator with XRE-family HTH domain
VEVLAGEIAMDPNTLGSMERGIWIPYARTMERYIANLQKNVPTGQGLTEADIAVLRSHALPNPPHPALVRRPKVSVETARAFTQVINDCFGAMVPPINRSELARRLGCSPSYATLLLNGERVPSEEMMEKIREVLHITREDHLAVLQAYTEEHGLHTSGRSHASRARRDDASPERGL